MSGLMVRHAPRFDGSEDIGTWVDVAWTVYLEAGQIMHQYGNAGAIEDLWDDLATETAEDGKPLPEQWGTSEQAQRGQEALMSMLGGTGMAPSVGEEV